METVPIEYEPMNQDKIEPEPEYYYPLQGQPQVQEPKPDFFSSIDKSTWIIAFAVFLLGFFMGKTMQPVILRYT
jgi:hypothetical protein